MQLIILFGPPGAGKGVQATLLSEKCNLYHLETSKIIEQKINFAKKEDFELVDGKKYFLIKEKQCWETGILCNPILVAFWLNNKIKELAELKKNVLIEGSPRTLEEAKKMIPFLKKTFGKDNIKLIFIKISPKITLFRNSHRKICSLMRHSILYSKETEKLRYCPLDGSKLIRRKGLDDLDTIKIRLQEYKKRTLPLIKYFKRQGLSIYKINGEKNVAEVFESILKIIS